MPKPINDQWQDSWVDGASARRVTTVDSSGVANAAENAAVTGNPVIVGGRYDTTPRTLDDGDAGALAVDVSGHLLVADSHDGLGIASGEVAGHTFVHKFGNTPDFDSTDGTVDVWDGADDGGINAMVYTYSATADIGLLSSSSASDTEDIEIQGLDSNYDLVTQTVTLTGQTDVDISTTGVDLIRVFRMKNVGSNDLVGDVYIRTNGSGQSGGVPSTANTVRAVINNGNNQTLMAIYTIPNGKTGYLRSFFAGTAGASRTTNYVIDLYARPFGQVFQLKHKSALTENGTSYFQHKYVEPEVFAAKTDIVIRTTMTESPITDGAISAGFDIVLVDD